jgi:hypothetical protein
MLKAHACFVARDDDGRFGSRAGIPSSRSTQRRNGAKKKSRRLNSRTGPDSLSEPRPMLNSVGVFVSLDLSKLTVPQYRGHRLQGLASVGLLWRRVTHVKGSTRSGYPPTAVTPNYRGSIRIVGVVSAPVIVAYRVWPRFGGAFSCRSVAIKLASMPVRGPGRSSVFEAGRRGCFYPARASSWFRDELG